MAGSPTRASIRASSWSVWLTNGAGRMLLPRFLYCQDIKGFVVVGRDDRLPTVRVIVRGHYGNAKTGAEVCPLVVGIEVDSGAPYPRCSGSRLNPTGPGEKRKEACLRAIASLEAALKGRSALGRENDMAVGAQHHRAVPNDEHNLAVLARVQGVTGADLRLQRHCPAIHGSVTGTAVYRSPWREFCGTVADAWAASGPGALSPPENSPTARA